MRIREDEPCAHALEGIHPEHPPVEHPLVDEDGPLRLRGHRRRHAREIGRKTWPDAGLDRRDLSADVLFHEIAILALYDEVLTLDLGFDTESLENEPRHPEVLRYGLLDRRRSLRHGDQHDEGPDLHMIAEDRVVHAFQSINAVDRDRVRSDPVDAGAHLRERKPELLDVWLARRVVKHRAAFGQDRREQRVLRGGHRRLVADHRGTAETRWP